MSFLAVGDDLTSIHMHQVIVINPPVFNNFDVISFQFIKRRFKKLAKLP